jgi:thiol:disulfide interchange protein DsbD
MYIRLGALIAALFLLFAPLAHAQISNPDANVRLSLVADRESVAPGERFTLALRQMIAPGWHTYWRNPGDAGLPPEMEWTVPEGFSVGAFLWPPPKTFVTDLGTGALVNYVYEGEVLLPMEAMAPAGAQVGDTLELRAFVSLLVCDDSTCVPEEAEVRLSLPVTAVGAEGGYSAAIAETLANVPQALPGLTATITDGGVLSVAGTAIGQDQAAAWRDVYFFPDSQSVMDHNVGQSPRHGPDGVSFTLVPQTGAAWGAEPLNGVVAYTVDTSEGPVRRGFAVVASPGAALPGTAERAFAGAAAGAPTGSGLTLWVAILFAFLGGLILNLMPCVLPVLSVKAIGLVHAAQAGQARRHGVLFLAGVIATFLALAGLLIALQAGGAALGWGFQLQSPWFMGALALLFFLIGLNLLGAFEVVAGWQNAGQALAARGGDLGAFFTGVLAVVAATPCTAPFMGGAMGFAAAQPPSVALLVFLALALGFALPFTALSFAPGLVRALPRPGPWMERFKQALAFPMFATAAWAAWVMAAITGADGVLLLLALAVALGLAVWGLRAFAGVRGRLAMLALSGALVVGAAAFVRPLPYAVEAWSPARVAALQAEGRTVFVNFTADWCVTCRANEQISLASPLVVRTLGEIDAVYLKADWTERDPVIAEALAQHGRTGVPLYLVYRPGEPEPVILPQVLSPHLVADALDPS